MTLKRCIPSHFSVYLVNLPIYTRRRQGCMRFTIRRDWRSFIWLWGIICHQCRGRVTVARWHRSQHHHSTLTTTNTTASTFTGRDVVSYQVFIFLFCFLWEKVEKTCTGLNEQALLCAEHNKQQLRTTSMLHAYGSKYVIVVTQYGTWFQWSFPASQF